MIYPGDLFDVLPTLEADSIDACVTDPPYGIGFMGREWDTFKPGANRQPDRLQKGERIVSENPNLNGRHRSPAISESQIAYDYSAKGLREFQAWTERWAREVLRVLKPGGYLLVCGAPRSFHRMACGIEDAGFEVRDCLSWLFGQGFPKSLDVSKAIDRELGKPREVAGRGETVDRNALDFGSATGKAKNGLKADWIETDSNTEAAKQWEGWGTALKPAWEPIFVARKPLRGTVARNVLTYGTGALNIDPCRIDGPLGDGHFSGDDGSDETSRPGYEGGFTKGGHASRPLRISHGQDTAGKNTYGSNGPGGGSHAAGTTDVGRWPANVLLDEDAAAMLDEQTGELVSGANPTRRGTDKFRDIFGHFKGQAECDAARGMEVGGASRFYYVAKPSREERDFGCYDLAPRQRDESRKEGNPGGDNPRNRGLQPRGNFHPTVKPVELMRWLVRLVTPPGGTVLDPFLGSGTTGMACRYEHRQFIGIEREAEYVEIAERRISGVAPLFALERTAREGQDPQ